MILEMEVFTHHTPDDVRLRPVVVGSCPHCLKLHRFRLWRSVANGHAVTLSGRAVRMPEARYMALSLSGRVMTPEDAPRSCESHTDGVRLTVRDEPLTAYRVPVTGGKTALDAHTVWRRTTPDTGDVPPY